LQAYRIACASNLRQIATAWVAYAHANKGLLPAAAEGGVARPNDFLVWYPPITQEKLDRSALAPHLGRPLNPGVFRCPSDDWESHTYTTSGFGPYLFSYCMNVHVSNTWSHTLTRRLTRPMLKIWHIKNPSGKLVIVEEDERVISDGVWAPRGPSNYQTLDEIADRHQPRYSGGIDRANWNDRSLDNRKRANAFFADAHVEFVNGTFAYDMRNLDPAR
jgi:prepilin-type processing-associated H-X9-DG protein